MLLKNIYIKKILVASIVIALISIFTIAYLSISNLESDDSQLLKSSQKVSKALVMRGLDQVERIFGSATYTPTPFDSSDFEYADLSHPYFERIRNDKRVAHFYHKRPIDFSDAISIREYLRDLFPHGVESSSFLNTNVLEMIDAAEHGERFLCGNISKMLVELIQAGGTQARTVGLQASHSGHVVVEMWSNQFNKWILLDPDYNVHYTNKSGVPLSAIELYGMSQDGHEIQTIKRITGNSKNTLHNSNTQIVEQFYRNGFAILFYNKWVDKNLPRRHPARSPSIMGFYVGKSEVDKFYYKHDADILDDEIITILYKKPSKH